MTPISRILIADDHSVLLEGLKSLLASTVNLTVADVAVNADEVLAKVRANEYDMLILDISMPGRSGLDIIRDIKRMRPKLSVVVFSMHPEDQYALRAMKLGASAYLTKGISSRELVDALQQIAMGKRYVSKTTAEILADRLNSDADIALHERLSDREFQIMLMIASGVTPKVISERLLLGKRTVNNYRSHILEKMKLKGNVDLARYAFQHNLV